MTAILVRSSPQGVNPERRLSATIFSMDFSHQPIKAFGELRRTKTEKNERKKAKIMEEPKLIGVEQLSDKLWQKIIHNLGAMDRIRLGQCCKRMRQLALGPYCWDDAKSLEIRADFTAPDSPYSICPSPPSLIGPSSSSAALLVGLPSLVRPNKPKRQPKGFRIRLQFANGRSSRIRTFLGNGDPDLAEKQLKALLNRLGPLSELTIWDCCLSDRYRSSIIPRCANSLKCLRLWNCHRWLDGSQRSPQLLFALLGLPSLRQLLFLDSSPAQPESNCRWLFSKQMARSIVAPLTEFQLTNCRLPLRSLEILLPKCGNSLRRLAIGCTFGKDQKRKDYLRIIRQFRELADLDLPPFIFHLEDKPQPDQWAQRLFQSLPQLRALGFRHFNSSALFRFIEFHLPKNVRVLRVHHNSHRVPNFAEIGLGSSFPPLSSQCPARSASLLLPGSPESQKPSAHPQKKHSIISRSSILSSSRSSDSLGCQGSPSAHSISAQPNPCRSATFCSSGPQQQPFSSSSSSACSSLSWAAWPLASSSAVPQSKRAKSFSVGPDDALSMATSSTWCTLSTAEEGGDGCQNEEENGGKQLLADLARRKLTIFAIGEERQGGATGRKRGGGNGGRQQRLRRSKFAGVEVIYVSSAEAIVSQEVLGRMGSPIQSPYVYTTGQSANQNGGGGCQNNRKGMRVIRGDLVRTIPLASLGMESDWESDEETA